MKFKTMTIRDNQDKVYATFWVDEDGNIDEGNLPHEGEVANILKALMNKELFAEFTGSIIEE